MTIKKRIMAIALAAVVGLGAVAPVGAAEASPIQPLTYPTYVNGINVDLQNSITYGGHTYVKLRDIGAVANMGIYFRDPSFGNEMGGAGGGRLAGIHIDQPSFIYTRNNVTDWTTGGDPVKYDKCVDLTGVYEKYYDADHHKKLAYSFNDNTLTVPDGNGSKTIEFTVFNYQGRKYVPVDEYRDKIQPYMVDICMQ